MYYKKNNNKGANAYGEARRGKGQNHQSRVLGASTASISNLEIAREEDHLEEELGYRAPGLNNGGAEGADAEDVQLGWLVNASAVRFSIRSIFFFFFFFFFFVCVVFVSAIEMRKRAAREGKFKNFQTWYRKRADERARLIFYHHSRTTTHEREESAGLLIVSKSSSRFSCSSSSFTLFLFFFFVFLVVDIARTRIIATTS